MTSFTSHSAQNLLSPHTKRKRWSPRYIRKYNLKATWQQTHVTIHSLYTVYWNPSLISSSCTQPPLLQPPSLPPPLPTLKAETIAMVTAVSVKRGWFYECLTELDFGDSASLSISALLWSWPRKLFLWNEAFLSHANHYVRVTVRLVSPQMYSDVNWYQDFTDLVLHSRHGCLSGHLCAYLLSSTLIESISSNSHRCMLTWYNIKSN